jgi:hypothetical protein
MKWSGKFGQRAKVYPSNLLNSSGHLNCGNKLGFTPVPWVRNSLRKPFKEALEYLNAPRAQPVSVPVGDFADKAQNAAAAVGGATAQTACPSTLTAGPIKIGSQGAPQSLSAPTHSAPAHIADLAAARPVTLVPPVTVRPIFERRPLTSDEKNWLLSIMRKRALPKMDVMDELVLPRLNTSIWMSVHQGATVSPDILERLSNWFAANAGHIQKVA